MKKIEIRNLKKFIDERGFLLKILENSNLTSCSKDFGEIYISAAKSGQTKANHFHLKTTEWFCVIKGKCLLKLKDLDSNEEQEIVLSEENSNIIKIPPNVLHSVKNTGENEILLLVYADRPYDFEDTDTYPGKF